MNGERQVTVFAALSILSALGIFWLAILQDQSATEKRMQSLQPVQEKVIQFSPQQHVALRITDKETGCVFKIEGLVEITDLTPVGTKPDTVAVEEFESPAGN